MKNLIEMEPAYLLHSRPFRDTSLLLDFITPGFGRISAVSRGARSAKSRSRALLQPFTPLHVSLSGKSELKSLRNVELRKTAPALKGERLFSALYINEIIMRLFQSHEADAGFFHAYEVALVQLCGGPSFEAVLRNFELILLETLGYGVDFSTEADTHNEIEPSSSYYFQEQRGFIRMLNTGMATTAGGPGVSAVPGQELLYIADRDFSRETTRKVAKALLRTMLASHLGDRPLAARKLFAGRQ